jgi:hypothetical protein
VCKETQKIDYAGYLYQRDNSDGTWKLSDREPVHTPESCCFGTLNELIEYTNTHHPFFSIQIKEGVIEKGYLP